ncbi:DUF551 domain-containing protein [Escherichia coli]|nr:DUF551 domain-containing protein [Escherichia coli]EII0089221.1 DUF551 domain-containing protein [Escherichia coli]EIY1851968.1 DUF551 domain-containing protein [Escherichia coli]EKD5699753.1 DUF551 domain-containing protein [Escherichia coli]ELR7191430.1 DUF551 domain-containing protein [Escherichia coli]MBF9375992.1 DUF551 domain-containing protein [Escherichia coli]
MTTITDKELIKEIKERIGSLDVRDNIERRAYEIALASLEAEPIAMVVPDEMDLLTCHLDGVTKTYADGWNACRVAMLQAGNFRENKNSSTNNFREISETSTRSPITPDGWISCSERMPPQDDWILIYSKHGEYMAGQVQGEYVELSDGTLSWLGNALFWMPLPEPPQEAK